MNEQGLNILLLEDRSADAEMIQHELRKAGIRFTLKRVLTEAEFRAELSNPEIDLILADYARPSFDGLSALALAKKERPEVPFIFVSGTMREDLAIESLHEGATDYVLKDRLQRLGSVVQRALREAKERAERQSSEERVRLQATALASVSSSIMITDCRGTILAVNPAFTTVTGYAAQEVIGQNPRILRSGEQDAAFYERMWQTIVSGRMWRGEITNRRKDGGLTVEEMTITPLRDAQGAITHYVATRQDITERTQAEARIHHLNQLLRAIRDVNQLIVRERNPEQLFAEACTILEQTRGYSLVWIGRIEPGSRRVVPAASAGKGADCLNEAIITWDETATGRGPMGTALRTLQLAVCQNTATDPDFAPWRELALAQGYASVAAVPMIQGARLFGAVAVYADRPAAFDSEELGLLGELAGDLAFALQSIDDERERTRAEMALRESEARFRQVIEASPVPLSFDNAAREIEYVNPKFVQTFGYSLEDIPTVADWFARAYPNAEYRQSVMEKWEAALQAARREDRETGPLEVEVTCRNGSVRTVEFLGTFVGARLLVAANDLTEKKRFEAQLLRSQRLESIGALAGGIAHDLNNILSPVLMVADLLRHDLADEYSRQMIDLVKTSALRGADLVKQILSFARGVSGERVVLNPGYLVKDMANLARDTFPRSIHIETCAPRDVHFVLADPTQLHQVLLNLCVNARDAMTAGGTLLIEALNIVLEQKQVPGLPEPVSGPYALLTVTDTGSGIAPELLDKVFEPFFTTKTADKGTGLGLSTVLSIVKSHHGFIEVFSRVGEGTTFKVYLPATLQAQADPSAAKPLDLPAGHGEQILLVDDDHAVLEMTKEILQAFQYRVLAARDGEEALNLYRQQRTRISLIVTDLMMPVMDGPALIQKVLELDATARIVCVSGLASESKLAEVDRSQVAALLNKPYTTQRLLQTIREALA